MSYKDTLELYDELIAGGCTEAQARAQAKQLGAVGTELGAIRTVLDDIRKDLFWMRIIGGVMCVAFFSNCIFK